MEVPLEPSWIRENFEFSEPDFYKQVTDRGSDLTGHKTYTLPVERCSLNTSQEKQNDLDMNLRHLHLYTNLTRKRNRCLMYLP